jgi:soluble lytic murein transglycosylase-like protein
MVPALLASGLAGLSRALPSIPAPSAETASLPRSPAAPLSAVFTPEVARWSGDIAAWSAQYDLAPELIATVMQIESCGDPRARSSAGAEGLFQVMPFHFVAGERPSDPQVNARRGLAYLARSMQLAGDDLAAGFAGYNGGHAVIDLPPEHWPAETQRYVRWATGIFREAQAGEATSPTLLAWLEAGGAYLCRQAASTAAGSDA